MASKAGVGRQLLQALTMVFAQSKLARYSARLELACQSPRRVRTRRSVYEPVTIDLPATLFAVG